jgi:hypothetical protein
MFFWTGMNELLVSWWGSLRIEGGVMSARGPMGLYTRLPARSSLESQERVASGVESQSA